MTLLLVDRKTRPWAIASGVLLVAAVGVFVAGARAAPPRGPSGGSVVGLTLGAAALVMLLLALFLGARKKLRTWRIGRAYTWMQVHVWMGLLCYPVAYLHAGGLRWGSVGSLTWVVMLLLTLVWVSGLIGLALQQFLPRLIFERVAREVTYEQHPHVLRLMRQEAEAAVAQADGGPDGVRTNVDTIPAGATLAAKADATSAASRLGAFYVQNVRPFLEERDAASSTIRSRSIAEVMFRDLRRELPTTMHAAVTDLEVLVDERRQMLVQASLHRVLHGWLFVHVPMSYGLAVLVILHAIFAVRYVR